MFTTLINLLFSVSRCFFFQMIKCYYAARGRCRVSSRAPSGVFRDCLPLPLARLVGFQKNFSRTLPFALLHFPSLLDSSFSIAPWSTELFSALTSFSLVSLLL